VEEAPDEISEWSGSLPSALGNSKQELFGDRAYSWVKQLGRGQYGTAHLVIKDDRELVAKVVLLDHLKDRDKALALQEVEILRRLHHPNIVRHEESWRHRSINQFEFEEALVNVMEYCAGGDLRAWLQAHSKHGDILMEGQILGLFIQMLHGLQYIHSQNVLHRDLKTSNMLLDRDYCTVKIGDFGIARVLESTSAVAVTMLGTPYYMSPEVCKGEPYREKSDVWSLGCVLYEMCMFRHAFQSQSLLGLVYCIVSERVEPLPAGRYSPAMSDLVMWMLAKAADERPSPEEVLGSSLLRHLSTEEADPMPHGSTSGPETAVAAKWQLKSPELSPLQQEVPSPGLPGFQPPPPPPPADSRHAQLPLGFEVNQSAATGSPQNGSPSSNLGDNFCPPASRERDPLMPVRPPARKATGPARPPTGPRPPPCPPPIPQGSVEHHILRAATAGLSQASPPASALVGAPTIRRPAPPSAMLPAGSMRCPRTTGAAGDFVGLQPHQFAATSRNMRSRTQLGETAEKWHSNDRTLEVKVLLCRIRSALLRRRRGNWVQAFALHDTTGHGVLGREEFSSFLTSLGLGLSFREVQIVTENLSGAEECVSLGLFSEAITHSTAGMPGDLLPSGQAGSPLNVHSDGSPEADERIARETIRAIFQESEWQQLEGLDSAEVLRRLGATDAEAERLLLWLPKTIEGRVDWPAAKLWCHSDEINADAP